MNMDVPTRSFDFARTGANTAETVLTPAAVQAKGLKVLQTLRTDDPRIEAQPLYLSGVNIGGKNHNVIYEATMANTIYAWDADTGQQLWSKNLGMPINESPDIDMPATNGHPINVKWGILSTPVIDRAAGTLYACAWISTDKSGKWQSGEHFLAALDIVTGAIKPGKPLLSLQSQIYNPGSGQPVQKFLSSERKQRAALALANGAVIICFGTIAEGDALAQGWVMAVDIATWAVAATWVSTVNGGGGIWMSGAGPAIQTDGSIWLVTGNGSFDGGVDFGQSVVRLRYTPAQPPNAASLTVAGSWTPWADAARVATGNPQAEAKVAKMVASMGKIPKPSNFRMLPQLVRMGFDPMENVNRPWADQDLGASGIVLIESMGIALVSGKDGILYTLNLGGPGNTVVADLTTAATPANYAKLASPPILYTFYDPNIPPAPANPTEINHLSGNVTHHLHGTPVAWLSAAHGQMHFCGGENGNLRAWTVNPDKSSSYLGCSSAYASANCVNPPGGMPGWGICLSANGKQDGIVWAMIPYGDANMTLTNGRFLAYNASQLAAFQGGSGEIVPLWDSQTWNWNYLHPKFNRPIAVNGKIIVPTYDGRVLVVGLA